MSVRSLMLAFVLLLFAAVTMAFIAIWSGDQRWGSSAVLTAVLSGLSFIAACLVQLRMDELERRDRLAAQKEDLRKITPQQ